MSTYRKYRSSSGGYRRGNAGKVVIWCLVIFLVISVFPVLFSMSGPADRDPSKPQINTSEFIVEDATFLTYKFHEDLTAPFFGDAVDNEYGGMYPVNCTIDGVVYSTLEVQSDSEAYSIVFTDDAFNHVTVYTSSSGWLDGKYRVIFINDLDASPDFIAQWLADNADPVLKKLSGTWEFKEIVDTSALVDGYYVTFPFYADKFYFESISLWSAGVEYSSSLGDFFVYELNVGSFLWREEFLRRITFDGNVYVPAEFYDFVITNATRVS